MATVIQQLPARSAIPASTNGAQHKLVDGTNFPVASLAYDAATSETAYWQFGAISYGSGNITAKVAWYADTATSGGVVWGLSLAAITPDADTQDIETKAFATEVTQVDTHLGTTGQRLHEVNVTINQLDSIATGDYVTLRVARKTADASDDMTGDAQLIQIVLSYSDT